MKRLLILIIVATSLQACSFGYLGFNRYVPRDDRSNPKYYEHNSTYGYDIPVSPTDMSYNIEKQPAWGPAGYDCAPFYYMPELNVYYDVNNSLFYYPSGRSWIASQFLPSSYCAYDLYRTYKVVLNYASPWQHNEHHRTQFRRYRDDRSQMAIYMSRDPRYNQCWNNHRPWVDPRYCNHR